MADNPYPIGSPEAIEWQSISDRHEAAMAELGTPVVARIVRAEIEAHAADSRILLGRQGLITGPDCSQYQGKLAWDAVAAAGHLLGAYKVSEGRTYEDPAHPWNRAHAPAAGLIPLAYHYLYGSTEYALNPALWGAQTDFYVSKADPAAGHALDVEAAMGAGSHLGVREWVAEYRRLMPGHPLGAYSNRSLWRGLSRIPYDPAGLFDWWWHAGIADGRYTSATGTIPQQWAGTGGLSDSVADMGYPDVRLWQITDHAAVPGIFGTCDGNVFQGTPDELRAMLTGTTPGDDMSQADVDAILKGIDDRLAPLPTACAQAVARQQVFRRTKPDGTPFTFMDLLQAESLEHPLTSTDVQNLINTAVAATVAQVTALPGTVGSLTTGEIHDAVRAGLLDALPQVHLGAGPEAAA